jgi:hypothetical protein
MNQQTITFFSNRPVTLEWTNAVKTRRAMAVQFNQEWDVVATAGGDIYGIEADHIRRLQAQDARIEALLPDVVAEWRALR